MPEASGLRARSRLFLQLLSETSMRVERRRRKCFILLGSGLLVAQGEEGEVDGAVGAELLERGEGGEVVVLSVFEDEDAVGGKPFLAQDEGWELVEVSQSVGRVGEDQVERRNGWGVETL